MQHTGHSHSPFLGESVLLLWRGTQESAVHRSELRRLSRRRERAWIMLPSAMLQTRYRLNAVAQSFGDTETPPAIQASLRQSLRQNSTESRQYHLIAQPHADAPCYHISNYIKQCVAGDLGIAERLRGRTVIHLYQTETAADDLFNDTGVSAFVERVLAGYLKAYGKQHLVGFTCELPRFLSLTSVLEAGISSIPWSPALSGTLGEALATYLPLVFYETYDSAAVRNTLWRELTTRFATCFLGGVRDFCHQEGLRFALSLPASAKALAFELGAMLAQVDCPILNATEIDTSKRFVVAKWLCSDVQQAAMSRKDNKKTDRHTPTSRVLEEACLGFNLWINGNGAAVPGTGTLTRVLSQGYPKRRLLMVAPTQSLWTKPDEKMWNRLTKAWGWLCQSVWESGYDFRIVSEQELGSAEIVSTARANRRGGLCFPNCQAGTTDVYNVVLLPSCISLQEETVKCLRAFTKAKGRLIADEPTPYLLNGRIGLEPYPLEQLIYGRRTTILRGPPNEKVAKLEKCLRKWVRRIVSVYVKPGNEATDAVHVHHRSTEKSELFYLFNTSTASIATLIEISGEASQVVEWALFTETKETIGFWHADGKTYLNSTFAPKHGRLFVVS